ncbi:epoxide hydrolase family protein [[Actinomadura] parvosata]|uniref:epoxide hydrolase family protein n=1 Tax=[Actinomadura] parvosata TaxID=1955412 RepID=UPI00406D1BBC
MSSDILPFRIEIPQADLDDLQTRLDLTCFAEELPDEYGVSVKHVRRLAEYWRNGYDWRAWEAEINRRPQFTTVIDGQRIHFLHVRSPKPDALPLILTHGWPGSLVEFLDVIEPLSRDFHLVIPSLPGFGFSAPIVEAGWGTVRTARAWAGLMSRLGYERYARSATTAARWSRPRWPVGKNRAIRPKRGPLSLVTVCNGRTQPSQVSVWAFGDESGAR